MLPVNSCGMSFACSTSEPNDKGVPRWSFRKFNVEAYIRRRRSSEMPRLLADRELLGDEGEGDLSYITPPMVNDQGMSSIGDCAELGDRGIVLLQLVSSRDDRQRDRMVLLARNEQEWATLGVPGVDLVFRPGVEVGGRNLEDWRAGTGDRVRFVQLVGFVLIDGVSEGITELLVGQRDGPAVVEGIAQHRR